MKTFKKEYEITKMIPNTKYVSDIDIPLLLSLFNFQTYTQSKKAQNRFLKEIIGKFITVNDIKCITTFDKYGNMYITKGKADVFPCVVSHIDTVHKTDENFKAFHCDDFVIGLSKGEQCGLGADPKNGVYILLQLLLLTDNIKCALFLDEECGCCGSRQANMKFFKDCAFVMQFDRNSFNNDVIEHTNGIQVLSETFKERIFPIMLDYDYDFNYGSCTDVGQLTNNSVNINTFNVSNGSFDEHMDNEKCSIPHMLNALNFGIEVIEKLSDVQEVFLKEVIVKSRWGNKKVYNDWEDWDSPKDFSLTDDTTYIKPKSVIDEYVSYGVNDGEYVEATEHVVDCFEDRACAMCEMFDVIDMPSKSEAYCTHCGISYYIPEHLQKHERNRSLKELY